MALEEEFKRGAGLSDCDILYMLVNVATRSDISMLRRELNDKIDRILDEIREYIRELRNSKYK